MYLLISIRCGGFLLPWNPVKAMWLDRRRLSPDEEDLSERSER